MYVAAAEQEEQGEQEEAVEAGAEEEGREAAAAGRRRAEGGTGIFFFFFFFFLAPNFGVVGGLALRLCSALALSCSGGERGGRAAARGADPSPACGPPHPTHPGHPTLAAPPWLLRVDRGRRRGRPRSLRTLCGGGEAQVGRCQLLSAGPSHAQR